MIRKKFKKLALDDLHGHLLFAAAMEKKLKAMDEAVRELGNPLDDLAVGCSLLARIKEKKSSS